MSAISTAPDLITREAQGGNVVLKDGSCKAQFSSFDELIIIMAEWWSAIRILDFKTFDQLGRTKPKQLDAVKSKSRAL